MTPTLNQVRGELLECYKHLGNAVEGFQEIIGTGTPTNLGMTASAPRNRTRMPQSKVTPIIGGTKGSRRLTAQGRANIAAAQKARWANKKAA